MAKAKYVDRFPMPPILNTTLYIIIFIFFFCFVLIPISILNNPFHSKTSSKLNNADRMFKVSVIQKIDQDDVDKLKWKRLNKNNQYDILEGICFSDNDLTHVNNRVGSHDTCYGACIAYNQNLLVSSKGEKKANMKRCVGWTSKPAVLGNSDRRNKQQIINAKNNPLLKSLRNSLVENAKTMTCFLKSKLDSKEHIKQEPCSSARLWPEKLDQIFQTEKHDNGKEYEKDQLDEDFWEEMGKKPRDEWDWSWVDEQEEDWLDQAKDIYMTEEEIEEYYEFRQDSFGKDEYFSEIDEDGYSEEYYYDDERYYDFEFGDGESDGGFIVPVKQIQSPSSQEGISSEINEEEVAATPVAVKEPVSSLETVNLADYSSNVRLNKLLKADATLCNLQTQERDQKLQRPLRIFITCMQSSGCTLLPFLLSQSPDQDTLAILDIGVRQTLPSEKYFEKAHENFPETRNIIIKETLRGDTTLHPDDFFAISHSRFQQDLTLLFMRHPVDSFLYLINHIGKGSGSKYDIKDEDFRKCEIEDFADYGYGLRCGTPIAKLRALNVAFKSLTSNGKDTSNLVLYEELCDAQLRKAVAARLNSIGVCVSEAHFSSPHKTLVEVMEHSLKFLPSSRQQTPDETVVPDNLFWGAGDISNTFHHHESWEKLNETEMFAKCDSYLSFQPDQLLLKRESLLHGAKTGMPYREYSLTQINDLVAKNAPDIIKYYQSRFNK